MALVARQKNSIRRRSTLNSLSDYRTERFVEPRSIYLVTILLLASKSKKTFLIYGSLSYLMDPNVKQTHNNIFSPQSEKNIALSYFAVEESFFLFKGI